MPITTAPPQALPLAAAVLAAALLTGGCASAPPHDPPDPGFPVPESWVQGEDGEPSAAPYPAMDVWWTDYGDRLDELVEAAFLHNHDLAAAYARVAAAEAEARIAGAGALPQANAGFDAARRRQNFIGFPIPGGDGQVLSTTTTTHDAGLDVAWEVDLWGRLRAGEAAALAGLQASAADYHAARLSLAGQTASAWFGLIEAAEQLELARAEAENRRRTTERIRRRYELGLRPALDLRLALSSQAGAEAAVPAREQALDAARRRLELLVGRYPAGTAGPEAEGAGPLPPVPPPVPAGLPAALIGRRLDLIAAERRLAAAGLAIEQARAALYPQLRLTGSAGRASGELEDLLDGDFSVWSVAAGLLQPLFQGGRLRAGVDLAEARREEALAGFRAAALRAFGEVEAALAAEALLADREAALERAVEETAAARDLAEERYDLGLIDYLTVLETQRAALAAESALLEARRQRLDARVDLHLALGGGFTPSFITPAEPPPAAPPAAAPDTEPRTAKRRAREDRR
jgi:NodT family efflux transporter outer membrane factor (OMF) lipoprotein